MKSNHIHLTVTDVEAAAEFLTKYFELRNQGGNRRLEGGSMWTRRSTHMDTRLCERPWGFHGRGARLMPASSFDRE